ncbi:MAG TPA: oxidoreductase, partial [Acidimicrobiia bacterium]|nr:oxidoreductase [Acidimicrobiia bacterium]
ARGGPLQLIAGGSGLVPLMAMVRSQVADSQSIPTRLLVSARAFDDIIYREELIRLQDQLRELKIDFNLTRSQPPDWDGFSRRVDHEMLAGTAFPPEQNPDIYICGPTGFVEAVASTLVDLGHQPDRVKTERFGPSGG